MGGKQITVDFGLSDPEHGDLIGNAKRGHSQSAIKLIELLQRRLLTGTDLGEELRSYFAECLGEFVEAVNTSEDARVSKRRAPKLLAQSLNLSRRGNPVDPETEQRHRRIAAVMEEFIARGYTKDEAYPKSIKWLQENQPEILQDLKQRARLNAPTSQ